MQRFESETIKDGSGTVLHEMHLPRGRFHLESFEEAE
jgi:hypothetical protein